MIFSSKGTFMFDTWTRKAINYVPTTHVFISLLLWLNTNDYKIASFFLEMQAA